MDLDMVREHEEAEFTTDPLPQNKPAPVHTPEARAVKDDSPEIPAVVNSGEKPAAAANNAGNPNRRALPPMGTGRRPGDAPIKKRRLRGMLRLIVEVLVGGIVGGAAGFGAVRYFGITPEQTQQLYIGASAGGLALLFGFWGLMHFDHH
jgi:hypothetical protein